MEYLRAISIPEEFIRFALDAINADAESDSNRNKEFIETYTKEIVILNNKCDKLMELKLSDIISEEDFIIKQSEFKKHIQELKLIIEERTNTNDNVIVNVTDLLKFGEVASEVYPSVTLEEKRIILNSLGSNLLIKDRKLEIQYEKPLLLLKDISSSVKGKRVKKDRVEPVQVVIKKGTYSDKYTINPLVLRKHDTHSKHNRLELPVFIAKSTNGKLKLTLDRVRLQNYLDLNESLADEFMQGFYINEPVINKNLRKYNDYKVLACEYNSYIENGFAKNKADLARLLCVSRTWISKVFKLGNYPR